MHGGVDDLVGLMDDSSSLLDLQKPIDSTESPSLAASAGCIPQHSDMSVEPSTSSEEKGQNILCPTSPAHTGTYTQIRLPFKPISKEEWHQTEKRRYYDRQQEREDAIERRQQQEAQKIIDKQEYERVRKRKQRERKKKAKATLEQERNTSDPQEENLDPSNPAMSRQEVSTLSRPYSVINIAAAKSDPENPRKREADAKPTHRINWCQPLIWSTIEKTARSIGTPFSPAEIWTESHLRALKAGSRPTTGAKSGGIFENKQDVVDEIKTQLSELRGAGVALTMRTIRGYMAGVINHRMPDSFMRADGHGNTFRCSDRFIQRFLQKEL
ncbi:hypothetical protein V565_233140, partial [Rhizoctonia solani 123E]